MANNWTPRIIMLVLFGLVLGIPLLLQPAREAPPHGDADRLIILTPHNEQIRYEFARAFNAWRQSQGRPPVYFDWRSSGGTSDLRNQVEAEFTSALTTGSVQPEYDLFFGGGDFEHNRLARGIRINRDGETIAEPLTIPATIPEDVMAAVFPDEEVGGVRLYHAEKRWIGIVLSSFGIIYNRDRLQMAGLPEPQTWADLIDPRYRQAIALADPGHSGSIAVTYNAVLQRHGWHEGWAILRRTFGNARYFTNSASKVPVDVSTGEAAAGMCIDFYGRFQAGAVGGDRLGYVDPVHMTVTTPDPISIMRGTKRYDLANEFVLWLLTTESQQLWQRRIGTPGGPERFEVRRSPIRRDLYTPALMATWVDDANPFEIATKVPDAVPDYYFLVAPISHAIAIDIHEELKGAWRAINDHPDHPRHAEMLERFDAMPEELTIHWADEELAGTWHTIVDDPQHPRYDEVASTLREFASHLNSTYGGSANRDRLLSARLRWMAEFKTNYEWIIREARQR